MTVHKFNLSNSSLEQIDLDQRDIDEVLDRCGRNMDIFGYSLSEMMKKTGFGEKKTLKWLNIKKKEGKVKVIRIPIIDISNRLNYTTVYILEMELNGNKE